MIPRRHNPMSAGSGRDGFIIVAVLWMLIALATLASIYSVYISNTAAALAVSDDSLQTQLLVTTSLELTAYRFSSQKDAQGPGVPGVAGVPGAQGVPGVPGGAKPKLPSRGGFSFRAGAANVGVTFVSEAARIDLNEAPLQMLAGLFAAFGVKAEDAVGYADRIVGWREPPKEGAAKEGAAADEEGLYRSAGLRYPPRGAPFPHVDELRLVYGLPPALIDRILPFVTVYSGLPKVNVLDAAPEVIAALPGMTPGFLNAFLDKREAGAVVDERSLPGLLGPSQEGATVEASAAYRVQVRIAFDNGRQVESEAVILTGTKEAPYHVLYWRDDTSNGSAGLRTGVGLR